MTDYRSLSHTRWECKYHVVFIPKGRRKRLYQHLRVHPHRWTHFLFREEHRT